MYCNINKSSTKVKILKYIDLYKIRTVLFMTDNIDLMNFAILNNYPDRAIIVTFVPIYLEIGEECSFKNFIRYVLQNKQKPD